MSSREQFVGLTWDHPRGYVALERAAREAQHTGLSLRWERQPLEGFESHPIEELAEKYDIVVIDHPHLGDAVGGDCFRSLESIFEGGQLETWRAQSIGRSFDSYRYAGQHWALPLDAASQVAVCRPDLLRQDPPRTWAAVLALARELPVCLSLAGPHALLTLFSMSASFGAAPVSAAPDELLPRDGAAKAWQMLSAIYEPSCKEWADKNPIGILDAMAREQKVAYCPLVYGYVNYAAPSDGSAALRFADVPAGPTGRLGSTLGGTGLAVSRRADLTDKLRQHLVELMSPKMQAGFIPFADGQPSARAAWADERVNAAWNGFFAGTRATLEEAIVRPRHPAYVPFQTQASAIVRDALARQRSADQVLDAIQDLYAQSRPAGSEV